MNQVININGNDYSFTYSETGNIWIGDLTIENCKIAIEIISKELDSSELKEFIAFIETKNLLSELRPKAEKIFTNYIDVVRFGIKGDANKYIFRLEGILYHGQKSTLIFEKAYKYSLLFKLYRHDHIECDDPYGLYLADIENALITGIRREQF